jgi:hypothetical protein
VHPATNAYVPIASAVTSVALVLLWMLAIDLFVLEHQRIMYIIGQREEDLKLLRSVLEKPISPVVREKFEDMLAQMTASEHLYENQYSLSRKQRQFVQDELDKFEPRYENLVSNGLVPRGREVEMPAVLQNLPKRPPTRKASDDE